MQTISEYFDPNNTALPYSKDEVELSITFELLGSKTCDVQLAHSGEVIVNQPDPVSYTTSPADKFWPR